MVRSVLRNVCVKSEDQASSVAVFGLCTLNKVKSCEARFSWQLQIKLRRVSEYKVERVYLFVVKKQATSQNLETLQKSSEYHQEWNRFSAALVCFWERHETAGPSRVKTQTVGQWCATGVPRHTSVPPRPSRCATKFSPLIIIIIFMRKIIVYLVFCSVSVFVFFIIVGQTEDRQDLLNGIGK
jgi:hypothetical protein